MTTTPDTPLRVAVIVASTREGRFAPVITNWFLEQARHRVDVDVDLIDLAELDIPMTFGAAARRARRARA